MPEPVVSVLVAARDAADTLAETLASVRAQTFADLEVVLVDDGSVDATSQVALAAGIERLVLLRNDRALGQNDALNRAFAASSGELVAQLDADDLWDPRKLELQVARLRERLDAGGAYCSVRTVDAEGRPLWFLPPAFAEGEAFHRAMLLGNPLQCGSTALWRRSVLEQLDGPWPVGMRHGSERVVGEAVARRAPVVAVREVLVAYRLRPGSLSTQTDSLEAETADFLARLYAPGLPPHLAALRPLTVASRHRRLAEELLERGDVARAGRHLRAALRGDPRLLRRPEGSRVLQRYLVRRLLPPQAADGVIAARRRAAGAQGTSSWSTTRKPRAS